MIGLGFFSFPFILGRVGSERGGYLQKILIPEIQPGQHELEEIQPIIVKKKKKKKTSICTGQGKSRWDGLSGFCPPLVVPNYSVFALRCLPVRCS